MKGDLVSMKDYSTRLSNALSKIKTVRIIDISQITELFIKGTFDDETQRYRTSYFYRGLQNSNHSLRTTLQRVCGKKQVCLEPVILRNFSKYALQHDPNISESIWRQMFLGQHHGLPTRLLDWTYSPLVGLHFATSNNDPNSIGKNDCVLWQIDSRDIESALPESYRLQLSQNKAHVFTVEMLQDCADSLKEYDKEMADAKSMVLIEPPSIDQRIINQYSYFTILPSYIDCLEEYFVEHMPNTIRYIIDKNLCWQIRDMLDQMNINERILFPGFDGLATWLRRYYFVSE